jgi:hypothetical protein
LSAFAHGSRSCALAAVALAFAQTRGRGALNARLSRWVEKTPTNERHLERLWREFPEAKVVQVVRDPLSVVASRKLLEERAHRAFTNLGAVLRDLARSYRIAARHAQGRNGLRHLLLRYEDVTADPDRTADRLSSFLDIERIAGLCCPTVAGQASPANTSFTPPAVRGEIARARDRSIEILTSGERAAVLALAGPGAAALGYHLPSIPRWRRLLLQGRILAVGRLSD